MSSSLSVSAENLSNDAVCITFDWKIKEFMDNTPLKNLRRT